MIAKKLCGVAISILGSLSIPEKNFAATVDVNDLKKLFEVVNKTIDTYDIVYTFSVEALSGYEHYMQGLQRKQYQKLRSDEKKDAIFETGKFGDKVQQAYTCRVAGNQRNQVLSYQSTKVNPRYNLTPNNLLQVFHDGRYYLRFIPSNNSAEILEVSPSHVPAALTALTALPKKLDIQNSILWNNVDGLISFGTLLTNSTTEKYKSQYQISKLASQNLLVEKTTMVGIDSDGNKRYKRYTLESDPNFNYAVKQIHKTYYSESPDGKILSSPNEEIYQYSGHKELSPGLFIPFKMTATAYGALSTPSEKSDVTKPTELLKYTIEIESMKINHVINEGALVPTIPIGTLIKDRVTGRNYYFGADPKNKN